MYNSRTYNISHVHFKSPAWKSTVWHHYVLRKPLRSTDGVHQVISKSQWAHFKKSGNGVHSYAHTQSHPSQTVDQISQ